MLAIEASQREASIALRPAGEIIAIAEESIRSEGVGDDLVPAIARLCDRCGVGAHTIGTIAVSIGPGGFTGLRVSVAVAKMLAFTTGALLVDVPTSLVAAECAGPFPPAVNSLTVLLAIKTRGADTTAWSARFRRGARSEPDLASGRGGIWHPDGPEAVRAIVDRSDEGPSESPEGSDPIRSDSSDAFIADWSLLPQFRKTTEARGRCCAPLSLSAAGCLRVAERLFAGGRRCDPQRILPIYPREPEAVTLWQSRYGP